MLEAPNAANGLKQSKRNSIMMRYLIVPLLIQIVYQPVLVIVPTTTPAVVPERNAVVAAT
jgi:hypothetical protein